MIKITIKYSVLINPENDVGPLDELNVSTAVSHLGTYLIYPNLQKILSSVPFFFFFNTFTYPLKRHRTNIYVFSSSCKIKETHLVTVLFKSWVKEEHSWSGFREVIIISHVKFLTGIKFLDRIPFLCWPLFAALRWLHPSAMWQSQSQWCKLAPQIANHNSKGC